MTDKIVRTNLKAFGYHCLDGELEKMEAFIDLLCEHFDCKLANQDLDDYEGVLTSVIEGTEKNLSALLDYWSEGVEADPVLQAKVDAHNTKWDAWINGDGDPFVSHPLDDDGDDWPIDRADD